MPGLQGLQERVPERGRHGPAEERGPAVAPRPARRAAGLPLDRRTCRPPRGGWPGRWPTWSISVARLPGYGWLLEKVAGLDRRRVLPPIRHAAAGPAAAATGSGPVAATAAERPRDRLGPRGAVRRHVRQLPGAAGRAGGGRVAGRLRLRSGPGPRRLLPAAAAVQGAGPRLAKRDGTRTLQNLDVFARQGLPILCLEPSCASALADDLPDLIDDQAPGPPRGAPACR